MNDKPLEQQLNDMLGESFDNAQKNAAEVDVSVDEDVKQAELEEPAHKAETKQRDKGGKFAKKEKIEAVAKEAESEPPAEEVSDQVVDEPEVVAPVSQAPDHWSAGAKAHWDKLNPVVRAEALKQQDFVNKLQSRHAQERKKYEAIDSVIEPQRNLLRANYGDEATGLKNLFALSDFASKDPRGFIQWFSQQRGVDLRGLSTNQPQQAIDPNVTALQQQIQQLTQHISGMSKAQESAVMSEIDRSYKEFSTNPANKYFENVREDMAFFIESGKANDWQTAYNMAVKINPEVSELIEAEKLSQANEKRQRMAEEAANKAQKAKAMNIATKGVVSATESTGSWTDTLNKTANKLLGA